jgi:ABC-type Fe3+-siderophore transport system permease subunit
MPHSLNYMLGVNTLYYTLTAVFSFVFALVLLLRSGRGYSVEDTEAHAVEYGRAVREGHGGMTLFLWAFFGFFLVFAIVYFVQHASEFKLIFAGG